MQVEFTKDKETKNAIRFTASFGQEISGGLYVAKDSELAKVDTLSVEVLDKFSLAAANQREDEAEEVEAEKVEA